MPWKLISRALLDKAVYSDSAYPGIGWIGLCNVKSDLGRALKKDVKADFFTQDYRELLRRPEVTATIIATDENFHFDPKMLAIEKSHDLFIENHWPLAHGSLRKYLVLLRPKISMPLLDTRSASGAASLP